MRRWLAVLEAAAMTAHCPTECGRWGPPPPCCGPRSVSTAFRSCASPRGRHQIETDPASPYYALARGTLGFGHYLSGDYAAAVRPLEEAVQSEASLLLVRMFADAVLAMVLVERGQLSRAREYAQAARSAVITGDLGRLPQTVMAYAATGAVQAARGQFDQARSALEPVLELRRKTPGPARGAPSPALLLARIRLETGDPTGAAELAEEAREVLTALRTAPRCFGRGWPKSTGGSVAPTIKRTPPSRSPSARWRSCTCSPARSHFAR